jgi:spherulation-specific family 4 protein
MSSRNSRRLYWYHCTSIHRPVHGSRYSLRKFLKELHLWIFPEKRLTPCLCSVSSRPSLNFTVVINPDSGPGSTQFPNDDFASQITKLNQYTNVQTVGYVHTSYATRSVSDVLADVTTYSGWATNSTGFAVNGIFFDEIPSNFTADNAAYLKKINQAVKSAPGLHGNKLVRNRSYLKIYLTYEIEMLTNLNHR